MANRFWVGNGGNWTDTAHWSTTSGGTGGAAVPDGSSGDNVFFDSHSFSLSGQTVTLNSSLQDCHNLDWTGVTNNPTFDLNNKELDVWGNTFTLVSGMSIAHTGGGGQFYMYNDTGSTLTLTTAGQNLAPCYMTFQPFSSSGVALADDLTTGLLEMGGSTAHLPTTFTTNNHNITCTEFDMDARIVITLGTSTITSTGYIDFDYNGNNVNNLSAASATIISNPVNTTRYYYTGAGQTVGEVQLKGTIKIYASGGVVNTLRLSPGQTYTIDTVGATDTLTIGTLLDANGNANNPILIRSSAAGSQRKIVKSSGTVSVRYVDIKDSNASGGATFIALDSTDSGNNTGWSIPARTNFGSLLPMF